MREQHPSIDAAIDREAPMWRYFDLPKFISFLDRKGLWFSRTDLLGDPLEGSFTRAREAERVALLANPPEGRTREELERIFRHNANVFASMPRCVYVNCWHLGDHESMAMWQGYGVGAYGVAVQSTFGSLDDVLPAPFSDVPMGMIFISRVHYVDYTSETERIPQEANTYSPFVCKSLPYRHENEVRALFANLMNRYSRDVPAGQLIEVDLRQLVHRVTVSPLAPSWFEALVKSVCARYGLEIEVTRSIVFSQPIF